MHEAMLKTTGEVLSAMKTMLPNAPDLTPETLELFAGAFLEAGLTPDELRLAARRVVGRERFFPSAAVLIEAVRPPENADAEAERAWLLVRRALERYGAQASLTVADFDGDGHALWALERLGWERIGADMGEGNRQFYRAEYVRYYAVARRYGQTLDYLAGRFERENGAGNFNLTPRLVGRPDWRAMPVRAAARVEETADVKAALRDLLATMPELPPADEDDDE